MDEIWAHSSLKWTVHSESQQPQCVPGKAVPMSGAARSNLPWVKMWRFPN